MEHKDRKKHPHDEKVLYKCEECNKHFTEAEATAVMKNCCGGEISKLQVAYQADPSPTGA